MPDIFDQIQIDSPGKKDIFDEISSNGSPLPADSNLKSLQERATWGNSILRSLPDTTAQSLGAVGKGAWDAMSFMPGARFEPTPSSLGPDINKMIDNFNPLANAANPTATNIAYGLGNAIPTVAMANPIVKGASALPMVGAAGKLGLGGITPAALGFGAFEGGKAAMQGQPVGPAALEGAKSGAAFGIGGKLGATVADQIANPLAKAVGGEAGQMMNRFAPNVGTGAGMATAGALMAPDGQKIPSALIGGGMGLANPMNPIAAKNMTTEQHDNLINEYANNYRDVLNPGKGLIQKVEIKSGKDLDDTFKLAAREGLVINRDSENKLDTRGAVQQLQPKIDVLKNQLNDALASDPHKQFDLEDLRDNAKDNMSGNIKNAEDLNKAHSQVDNAIDAEIARNGQFVNGPKLNDIKQGLWSKSYDPLSPNSDAVSRKLGNVAKTMIEEAYPQQDVQDLNKQMGKYIDLQKVLEASHGNVVQNGKIGRYASQGAGAIVGGAIGSHLPLLGDLAGPIAGFEAGGKVSDFMNDPARITGEMAKRVHGINIVDRPALASKRGGTILPELLNPVNQASALPNNSQPPLGIPNIFSDRGAVPVNPNVIRQGNSGQNNAPINMPNPIQRLGYSPTQSVPEYLQQRQNAPYAQEPILAGRPDQPYSQGPQSIVNSGKEAMPSIQNPITKPSGGTGLSPIASTAFGGAAALGIGSIFNPLNAQASQVKDHERLSLPSDQYTKKEEGFQASPYIDTKGNKTIGYGFKMDSAGQYLPKLVQEGKRPLTRVEADKVYTKLYANARSSAQDFAGDSWHNLSGQQQKALSDMAYNMGGKINGFKKLRQSIEDQDFNSAANEIMNSTYGRESKNRASRNAALIAMR